MGIIIDTSALVDLERKGDTLSSLPQEPTEVYLPAIVLAEVWIGIEVAPSQAIRKKRLGRIRALLEGMTVIPFTEELAPVYAKLYAELSRKGKAIPANDLAIASTALHYGHDVLVGKNDEAQFRRVPGLKVRVL